MLLPLFLQLGVFNAHVFKPAASALTSAFYWGAQMVGSKVLGCYLDTNGPVGRRAWVSCIINFILIALGWMLGVFANSHYQIDYVLTHKNVELRG